MSACSRRPVLLNSCVGRRSTNVQSERGDMDDRNTTSNNSGTIVSQSMSKNLRESPFIYLFEGLKPSPAERSFAFS
jgi:hypothetical protein